MEFLKDIVRAHPASPIALACARAGFEAMVTKALIASRETDIFKSAWVNSAAEISLSTARLRLQ